MTELPSQVIFAYGILVGMVVILLGTLVYHLFYRKDMEDDR